MRKPSKAPSPTAPFTTLSSLSILNPTSYLKLFVSSTTTSLPPMLSHGLPSSLPMPPPHSLFFTSFPCSATPLFPTSAPWPPFSRLAPPFLLSPSASNSTLYPSSSPSLPNHLSAPRLSTFTPNVGCRLRLARCSMKLQREMRFVSQR